MAGRPPVAPIPWLLQTLWADQAVGGQAYTLRVYKMTPCPCGASPQAGPALACQACGGTGLLYPLPPRSVLGIVSAVTLHTDLLALGVAQAGDLQVSTQPGALHLEPWDLVLVPWSTGLPMDGEVLQRGPGPTDTLHYRARLVEGAWSVVPATGAVTAYQLGRDFQVVDRTVTWMGSAPAVGTQYTLRYAGDFEWVVWDPPDPRMAFGVDLGQRAVLRKRYLVLRNAPPLSLLEGGPP